MSFIPTLPAPQLIGTACALLYMFTGILSVMNIGMAHLAIEIIGDFFVSDLVYTLLLIPCVILASWGIGRCIKEEDAAREALGKPSLATTSPILRCCGSASVIMYRDAISAAGSLFSGA